MRDNNIYRYQSGQNYELYTKNGIKHNLNGPALVINESEYFYIGGKELTYSEWQEICKGNHEEECFRKAKNSSDGIYVEKSSSSKQSITDYVDVCM